MTTEAREAVVVGAGLGGLACAARLARAGVAVTVVEESQTPGGYAGGFRRGAYEFEASLHLIDGIGPGEPTRAVLDELGVGDELAFDRPTLLREEHWPDGVLRVPVGVAPWLELVGERFPGARAGCEAFVRLAASAHAAYRAEIERSGMGGPTEVDALGALAALTRRSAGAIVDELIRDVRLRASLELFATGWLGVALDELAAPFFLVAWYGYQAFGVGYPRGGSRALVSALVAQIERHGGEIVLGNGARTISIERRRASGVELADGRRIAAPVVVSNASPRRTFDALLAGVALPKRYRQRLEAFTPSVSCVRLWLGLRGDRARAGAYDVYLCPSWDEPFGAPDPAGGRLSIVSASRLERLERLERLGCVDEARAHATREAIVVTWLVQGAAFREALADRPALRAETVEVLLQRVERAFAPSLRADLEELVVATPETFERYGGHGSGIYGAHGSAGGLSGFRLEAATPVEGVWLVGSWTSPGHGYSSVLGGGVRTARALLAKRARQNRRG